ncbi:MAG: FtsW/RodA/SpoVE family cell cycle protein [Patescibacteria group bacterium]
MLGTAKQSLLALLRAIQIWPGPGVRRHKPDYTILVTVLLLVLIGIVLQYAIGPALTRQQGIESESFFFVRHIFAACVGLVGLLLGWRIPLVFWVRLAPAIWAVGFALSILAILSGGLASRWIDLGFMSFQPVEVLKIGFVLCLAPYLAALKRTRSLDSWKSMLPVGVALGLITLVIVVLQRDLGSMVVIAAVVAGMVYLSGMKLRMLGLAALVAVAIGSLFIVSTPYRRDRVATFFDQSDCANEAYHACQALVGIGSGELTGRGIGRSVQVFGYLPEASNDSIFAIYAEVSGFIGVVALVVILGKFYQAVYATIRSTEYVLSLVAAGILIWLSVQTIMNIGAMLGILPLKGITLPYISYGGSSMMMVLFAAGVLLQVSSYTIYHERTKNTSNRRRVRRSRYAGSST